MWTRDTILLFSGRMIRMFAYGFLSIILVLYLAAEGLNEAQIGVLLTLTLAGDTVISLWMATAADRIGRKRMLIAGSVLMVAGGILFAATGNFSLLVIAAIVGVISPSGHEVGPFLSIEQAALSQTVPDTGRTAVFAWYNLLGSFATAAGALAGGTLTQLMQNAGVPVLSSYRVVLVTYAVMGLLLAALFLSLSGAVEVRGSSQSNLQSRFGLHKSRRIVLRLSGLFALDAFAGGFVMQSIIAYWFHVRFGVETGMLGGIFFFGNILAGISALMAARLASRIGLIRTMVFTHIPSNVLLILVPFMPELWMATVLLLLRFSISQMDVPTRQSYMMAVVSPEERSAAAGVAGVARSVGASLAPVLTGPLLASPALFSAPFLIAGALKIVYDLLLYRNFQAVRPPEEEALSRKGAKVR